MPLSSTDMVRRFELPSYQAHAIDNFLKRVQVAGKRVLEVGGSNLPRELVFGELGVKQWVCIDILESGAYQLEARSQHYAIEGIHQIKEIPALLPAKDYLIVDGAIENAVGLPDDYFDAVISITSLEHIMAMRSALRQINRTKKNDATFFSHHGPIWSSYCGHHAWVDADIHFNQRGSIPDFAHLLMTPPELFTHMAGKFGFERAEAAVQQVFHLPRVNRLFYEDYIQYFNDAGFSSFDAQPYGVEEIPAEVEKKLHSLYTRYRNFSAYGITVFAQ